MILRYTFLCFCFLLISSQNTLAHPETVQQIEDLLSARDQGWNHLLGILAFILSVTTACGFAIYTQIKRKLNDETRSKILENESRNMIRLGLRDYENFKESNNIPGIAHSALASAITHTRQAWFMASNMSEPLTYNTKNDLLALSGANLGYYYFELMKCISGTDTEHKEEYRKKAIEAVEAASLMIETCERRKETTNCYWWEPLESKLRVQYECMNKDFSKEFKKIQIAQIRNKMSSLIVDSSIPTSARVEMSKDWASVLTYSK